MKNLALAIIATFSAVLCISAQTDGPVMTFEFEKHDFGDVKEGEEAMVNFVFTNSGKKSLIISDVVGSCSCTVSSWPKEPILPGEKATITASYDTEGKSGSFNKSLTITSNASEETKRIFIKGNVISNGESSGTEGKPGSPLED